MAQRGGIAVVQLVVERVAFLRHVQVHLRHEAAPRVGERVQTRLVGLQPLVEVPRMTITAARLSITNANSSRVTHSGAGLVVRGGASGMLGWCRDGAARPRHGARASFTYASGLGDVPLEFEGLHRVLDR